MATRQFSPRLPEGLSILANRDFRRLAAGLFLVQTTGPTFWTALAVYVYATGGAGAVGVMGLAAMAPAALAAPFAGILADRGKRSRVAGLSAAARGSLLAATALAMVLDLPLWALALLAAGTCATSRVYYPAQSALLPGIVRSEHELVQGTAIGSTIENVGLVAGPAVGGALLVVLGPPEVVFACALAAVAASASVLRVREPAREAARGDKRAVLLELLEGWTLVARTSPLRLVIANYAFQTAVFAALSVVIVELAISSLSTGNGGVGLLTAALGAGGVAGGVVAVAVTGRLSLGMGLRCGTLLWACSVLVLGAASQLGISLLLLFVIGAGNVLVDVTSFGLIQRHAADEFRGRVFGTLEGAAVASFALGSAAGGVLVSLTGVRGALLAAGISLGIVTAIAWRSFARLDGTTEALITAAEVGVA
jgi:MFS family permease